MARAKTKPITPEGAKRDPIYAAIAAHRLAWAEHLNACDEVSDLVGVPKVDPTTATSKQHKKTTAVLAHTIPTTPNGLVDVLDYVANHAYVEEFFADESEMADFLKSLMTAAKELRREDSIQSAERRVAERAHA